MAVLHEHLKQAPVELDAFLDAKLPDGVFHDSNKPMEGNSSKKRKTKNDPVAMALLQHSLQVRQPMNTVSQASVDQVVCLTPAQQQMRDYERNSLAARQPSCFR